MTGNILAAARAGAAQLLGTSKSKLWWDATKYGSEPVRPVAYADYMHIPSACEDRQPDGQA
jgi:hypothetical protein